MTDEPTLDLIGETGSIEYRLRKRLTKVSRALEQLTVATGMLPAESCGTVSAREFNGAYSSACRVLQEEALEPNY